ncbi:MAG: hypothetical protein QE271_07445 [Bacteriovoracaceae bacterium]|nr:hypothetical protein [Bacteriovoracaceae bacterium]
MKNILVFLTLGLSLASTTNAQVAVGQQVNLGNYLTNGVSECTYQGKTQVYNCDSAFEIVADSIRQSESFRKPNTCWFRFKSNSGKTIAVLIKEARSSCSDVDPVFGNLYAIENFELNENKKEIVRGEVKFKTNDLVSYSDLAKDTQEFLNTNNYCD